MSKRDEKEINLDLFTRQKPYLNRYVEDVDRKINELMGLEKTIKALKLIKKNQETVRSRYHDFELQLTLRNIYMSLEDLIADFNKFKGAEDYLNMRSNQLMIEFTKCKDLEEDPGVKGGLLSESGRKAKEGSSVFIQEDYVPETSKSGRNCEEGGGVSMEGFKKQEDNVSETRKRRRNCEDFRRGLMEGLKIQENKMNDDGSDIRGHRDPDLKSTELNDAQKSRSSRLEKVISDESGYIDLNAYSSIKGLKGKIYRLMDEEGKSKEALIEYGQFDNVDQGVCSNVEEVEQIMSALMNKSKELQWLKDSKSHTIKAATKLSVQLIDFMFLMSKRKETMAMFHEVKDLLEWVIEDGNSLVLNMVISVMELVDKKLREMKETEKVKTESLEGSSVNMEEMEQKGSLYNDSEIDQFIDHLMKEVLRIEYIMKHKGLSSFFFRSDESEINEIWKRAVDLKIKELI